ncbi:hypothetical protein B0T25DRAFT_552147 [Lasiosphaeria hispida]|uniref:deoxyribose-phosphate aldolase n=1 Tax=Lasiosphaeria hispida TaxID=260671 RepID=A0AAJ0HBI9_9PEZI|nr:hypothetical protein B0T25DRAFT_552147 [Lasiosphaeria hispida]
MAEAATIKVSLNDIAKLIDHSLLHPTMTDAEVDEGLQIARKYNVAAACVKPYSIPAALAALQGTDVLICAVIGFPHGNSTTSVKVIEAGEAVVAGAHEVDMVVNVGKVLGGDWEYVRDEIKAVNDIVVGTSTIDDTAVGQRGALKVIFENDYLQEHHIVKLCQICTEVGVDFVKTSTGYGFVKQGNGMYSYKGATIPHLRLMKASCGPGVKIKAAGGIRTLDELLYVLSLGVSRVGATATVAIMDEARRRGITDESAEFPLKLSQDTKGGVY